MIMIAVKVKSFVSLAGNKFDSRIWHKRQANTQVKHRTVMRQKGKRNRCDQTRLAQQYTKLVPCTSCTKPGTESTKKVAKKNPKIYDDPFDLLIGVGSTYFLLGTNYS